MHPVLNRVRAQHVCALLLFACAIAVRAAEAPAASWANFLTGTVEGFAESKVLANPAGGFYLYSSGDRPLIKFNADGSVAWEVRREPGINDVREVAQLDILDNGDLIAIVGAGANATIFGEHFTTDGRWLVHLRNADASPVFVKALENCWLTAVKARPGGGYYIGGVNWAAARVGADPLPIAADRIFVAQFSAALDWIADGESTGLTYGIAAIRVSGSGASTHIWAAGKAARAWAFAGRNIPAAGVFLLQLGASGNLIDAKSIAPAAEFSALELRPSGGAHLAVKPAGPASDVLKLDANGATVWHASINGTIAALTSTDDTYVVGVADNMAFTAALDSSGAIKWRRQDGGRLPASGNGVALLSDGRLAISGIAMPSGLFIDDFFLRDFGQIEVTGYAAFVATLAATPNLPPAFRVQPHAQKFAIRGENVTLHTETYSPSGAALEWYKDASLIPNQTAADLILPNIQAIDRGKYFVEARNATGLTRSREVEVVVNSITVTTVAGTDAPGIFESPRSPIILPDGSILAADSTKNVIKRVTAEAIATFAGAGGAGLLDGLPAEALFSSPSGLALQARYDGPLVYVADRGNNALRRIRFAPLTGEALSVAKTDPVFQGINAVSIVDGLPWVIAASATSTNIWNIHEITVSNLLGAATTGAIGGIAMDDRPNLYVADMVLNEVRRVLPGGEITSVASGLHEPSGIVLDDVANIYVSERASHTIRKISPTGAVTTIAGLAFSGYQNGNRAEALFNAPQGICFRNTSLIVADTGNHCLREIRFDPLNATDPAQARLIVVPGASLLISVSGPAATRFTIESTAQIGPGAQWKSEGDISAGAIDQLAVPKPAATRFFRARQLP
jgi:hypothetical protein